MSDPVSTPPLTHVPPVNLIGEPAPPKTDPAAKAEKNWFLNHLKTPSRETVSIVGLIIDIGLRVLMSGAFLGMAWWWLCKVADIVNHQSEEGHAHLSDAVLVALLTTTTLNVLGLLFFVANYLFPKQGRLTPPSPPQPPTF
jgi:hypothetical protein